MVLFLCVSNESTYTKKGTGSRESLLSERTCSFFGDAANAASVRCSEAESNCMWTHCVRKETNAASVRCSEAKSNCMWTYCVRKETNAASVRCSEAESNCMWTHCVRKKRMPHQILLYLARIPSDLLISIGLDI